MPNLTGTGEEKYSESGIQDALIVKIESKVGVNFKPEQVLINACVAHVSTQISTFLPHKCWEALDSVLDCKKKNFRN